MSCEWNSNLSCDQLKLVGEMRKWMEAEEGLHGRSDDDFLLMFLRSCEFDLELTQKTLRMYYVNRIKYPEWCSNRDLNHPDLQPLLQTKFTTALIDQNSTNPTIIITIPNRFEKYSKQIDGLNKISSVMVDVAARRRNCQLNGCVVMVDFKDSPLWLLPKFLSLSYLTAITQSIVFGVPVRSVAYVLVNSSTLTSTIIKLFQPFTPSSFKNKIFCVSDWSKVGKIVPLEALPEEYGGSAGPMKVHEDAFLKEMFALNDYLLDDNKYGYKTKEIK